MSRDSWNVLPYSKMFDPEEFDHEGYLGICPYCTLEFNFETDFEEHLQDCHLEDFLLEDER